MMKKKNLSMILVLALLFSLLGGCSSGEAQKEIRDEVIVVTDTVGRTVEVPIDPESICCICPFSGPFLVMFGAGEQVTSACNNMVRSNLLTAICPELADAIVVKSSGSVNAEAVLDLDTDLIFVDGEMYQTPEERAKLDAMDIPYVVIEFENLSSQQDAILVIGETLGEKDAAQEYVDWCNSTYSDVQSRINHSEHSPIRLYHAVNEATRTDYPGSICAEWIAMAGVENVSLASDLDREGNKAYTTLEQIYVWDPDMIICNEAGVDDYILSDEKWAGLSCVEKEHVYQIPVGISRMGHPTSSETPLALMWLVNLLYPTEYDIDFIQVLIDYYSKFYDYEIDEEIAEAILEADEMRAAKTSVSKE